MSDFAIIVDRPGGPEVLQWRRRSETLVPGPGEILVRTEAVGVNFFDIYQRSGVYSTTFPFTPGSEASGVVRAVGDGVSDVDVGDRVTTSDARGAYAESFLVASDRVVPIPEGLSFDVAAAIPLQGLTAHYLVASVFTPELGDTVLVHAGAGGVGLLLTQLLVARGVTVITTASTEAKRQASRDAGATHAIEYEGFADRVREFTGGEGVPVVYDGVGKDTFDESLRALRVRGTLVLFGGASGQVPPFDLQRLNSGGSLFVTRPSLQHFMRTPQERAWRYRELFDALEKGTLTFNVGDRFPLRDAAAAHAALESRQTSGKVVLIH